MTRLGWLVLVVLLAIVFSLGLAARGCAETSLSGGYSGILKWHSDTHTVSVSALTLGAAYRPDRIEAVAGTKSFRVDPASFEFWTEQSMIDGSPDVNLTGIGYAFCSWPNLEIIGEAAAATSLVGNGQYRIGPFAGVKMPFVAAGKHMQFKTGFGWTSQSQEWFARIGLGFADE